MAYQKERRRKGLEKTCLTSLQSFRPREKGVGGRGKKKKKKRNLEERVNIVYGFSKKKGKRLIGKEVRQGGPSGSSALFGI